MTFFLAGGLYEDCIYSLFLLAVDFALLHKKNIHVVLVEEALHGENGSASFKGYLRDNLRPDPDNRVILDIYPTVESFKNNYPSDRQKVADLWESASSPVEENSKEHPFLSIPIRGGLEQERQLVRRLLVSTAPFIPVSHAQALESVVLIHVPWLSQIFPGGTVTYSGEVEKGRRDITLVVPRITVRRLRKILVHELGHIVLNWVPAARQTWQDYVSFPEHLRSMPRLVAKITGLHAKYMAMREIFGEEKVDDKDNTDASSPLREELKRVLAVGLIAGTVAAVSGVHPVLIWDDTPQIEDVLEWDLFENISLIIHRHADLDDIRHVVSPEFLRAIQIVESGFEPAGVSAKGAQGLMQLMPITVKEINNQLREIGPGPSLEALRSKPAVLRALFGRGRGPLVFKDVVQSREDSVKAAAYLLYDNLDFLRHHTIFRTKKDSC